jgi:superfamily II DNA or RNA helicase
VSFNENGEVDFDDNCASSKMDALDKIVHKHHPGEPVFILTDSAKFARVVTKRLGPLAREWSGRVNAKTRDQIKAEFGHGVRYIVAVIPAVAEGLDGLQRVCNVEVWLSESTNGMLNIQAEGRLNRRGQKAKHIYQYKIMAQNTDDDGEFEKRVAERRANHASMTKEA